MATRAQRKRPARVVSLTQAVIAIQGLLIVATGFASVHPLVDLTTHFAFQHLVASSVLLIIMLAARQWRWSLICVVLCVVSAARVVPWWLPTGRGAVAATNLRIFHGRKDRC